MVVTVSHSHFVRLRGLPLDMICDVKTAFRIQVLSKNKIKPIEWKLWNIR